MQKISIPTWMMNISYNGRIIPDDKTPNIAETGANCQVFAYTLLRQYHYLVPNFRSSELWADTLYSTQRTSDYQPFDLLFFHKKQTAYGAHIAVYMGEDQVIHLCKKVGKPVIWPLQHFFDYPEYAFLLGGKRFLISKT